MNSENDYLEFRKMGFWERVNYEYEIYINFFGKAYADDWLGINRPLHLSMEKLWRTHGFKTYGEYLDWETTHMDERNEYYQKEGVWELWLHG